MSQNQLYYGDNLQILREEIRSESIDLVYLDPPFNSKASYSLLFKTPKGHKPQARITAFEDTWHWGEQAEREFGELVRQPDTGVSEMMQSLRRFLGENDVMAYLTMMANRLLELHRVLKPTGSLYLHCDSTASHYLKIVLDSVFGKLRFLNEITWKRTTAHNDPKRYGRIADRIFFYGKTPRKVFHPIGGEYSPEQLARYKHKEGDRYYRAENLTAPHFSETRTVDWRGAHPGATRQWRFGADELESLYEKGRILLKKDGTPRKDGLKEYLDEAEGPALQDIWTDIVMGPTADERLGYPTQKPLALLERIIHASSNEGDTVLDPFCGCGTAIHASEKLKRQWIGIDITHLAISLVEKRLNDAFPAIAFEVHGAPKDIESARDLFQRDKYEFQWWADTLVNAQPYKGKKNGADGGIGGLIYFQDDKTLAKKIVVSVKGGDNVHAEMIRDLGHVVDREKASLGLFVTLAEPTRPMKEEAVKCGYYESPSGANFPKIQILTIEGLLNGVEQPRYPDLMRGGLTFKKAETELWEEQNELFR